VNRASIDNKPAEPEIVVTHLMRGSASRSTCPAIACSSPISPDRSTPRASTDRASATSCTSQGNLTGIAYAEI